RKREVLFAVVENYISSAEPVGSAFLSKNSSLTLSPASIRNVMAELEELGFVVRPHTSAGGVPTDLAYRFYVDRLMQLKPLTSMGIVENKILELAHSYTQEELNRMHNYLNQKLSGLSIQNLRTQLLLEMKKAQQEYDNLITQALVLGEKVLSDETREIHIEGQ